MANVARDQLSLFGLKETAHMKRNTLGQLTIDVLELSEPPKTSMIEGKCRDRN